MNRGPISLILLALVFAPPTTGAAEFSVNYLDGPDEGFNDSSPPHAQSQQDGNPAGTLGGQRRWAFEKALEFWGLRLDSAATIVVDAEMTNDTDVHPCDNNSAALGFAGPDAAFFFGSGATPHPIANTYYPIATANRLTASDNDPGFADMGANFNSRIDARTDCLGSNVWYYALGDAPTGTVSFYKTVLHEIAHGLGFLPLANVDTGELFLGEADIYVRRLEDHSTGELWPEMSSNADREASATDTNDLHWTGPDVITAIGNLASGTSGGHVEMYAPSSLEPGSSVSHWDKDVSDLNGDDELMEPVATGSEKLIVTDDLMPDIGWNSFDANNCTFASDRVIDASRTVTGTETDQACVSVTLGSNLTINSGGDLEAFAGQQIVFRDGFAVEMGGVLRARTDPSVGL